MYCFIFKNYALGGGELLIEHIAVEIKNRNEEGVIFSRYIDEEAAKNLNNKKIMYKQIKKWYSKKMWTFVLNQYSEVKLVVFDWGDYALLNNISHPCKKTIFYAISYVAFVYEKYNRFQNNPINLYILHLKKKCLPQLLQQGKQISMYEPTILYTQKSFGWSKDETSDWFNIIRIPEVIQSVDGKLIQERAGREKLNILSIARADFPFKGYLIGLIDFVANSLLDNLSLDIVTYGKDMNLINKKMNELSKEQRKKIHIYGRTSYENLEAFFQQAKLYIGMGTTIIDAAQRGILAIPVKADTYEVYAGNFFHDDYKCLSGFFVKENRIDDLVNYVNKLDQNTYIKLAKLSRKLVKEHYSVSKTTNDLTKQFEKIDFDSHNSVIEKIANLNILKNFIKGALKPIFH